MNKTVADYRKRIESLKQEMGQERKIYESTLEDFLKKYTEEFQIKPHNSRIKYETSSLKRLGERMNPEFLKKGVEYMLSNSEPITTLDLSEAISLDPRLQRYFLRDFIDACYLLSPRSAKVIKEHFLKTPNYVNMKKEGFQLWRISNKKKAEKYMEFLDEL